MQIDKQQIIQFLQQQGDQQKADQAEKELPQQVDSDSSEDQSLLQRLGIDPMALVQQFTGGQGLGDIGKKFGM